MKITDSVISLDLDDLVHISRAYNGSNPDILRESDPTTYMVGVWLGWFFALNQDLAEHIPDIEMVAIARPVGWEPGDIIPGRPNPLPSITVRIGVHNAVLTTDAGGRVHLPEAMKPGQGRTVGGAMLDVVNAILGSRRRRNRKNRNKKRRKR